METASKQPPFGRCKPERPAPSPPPAAALVGRSRRAREPRVVAPTPPSTLAPGQPTFGVVPEKGVSFITSTLESPVSPQEAALRPQSFGDFVGQPKTIERLRVMTGAARKRGDVLNHILLSGPPGLGKTSLAFILGHEMKRNVRVTSGPVVEKAGDLAGLLTNLEEGDVLFIDEIHRIPKTVEEYLYSAMEDFRIDIMIDQGPNARSVRLNLPKFTLVGATTRAGLLTAPLRSRFTLQTRLDYYSTEDLVAIVNRTCRLLEVKIDADGAREIASRARGTPRIVNNLVYFVRDFAQERGTGVITRAMANGALELLEIDAAGLDEMDKRLLRLITEHYKGGPVGIGTLAVAAGEEPETLEEVHEPFLIQNGFLQRTPQGRVITEKGLHAIGLKAATGGQSSLF